VKKALQTTADSRSGGYPYRHGGYQYTTDGGSGKWKAEERRMKVQEVVSGLKN